MTGVWCKWCAPVGLGFEFFDVCLTWVAVYGVFVLMFYLCMFLTFVFGYVIGLGLYDWF